MEVKIPDLYLQLFRVKNDVTKYPNAVLRTVASPVDDIASVQKLITRMSNIVRATGGVGLAAPQAGESKRVIIVRRDNRYVLINPVIEECSGTYIADEGCLSTPGLWGQVERHQHIVLRGTTPHGKESVLRLSDMEAVVPQHEIDHLDGIMFFDRAISDSLHWFSPTVGKQILAELQDSES